MKLCVLIPSDEYRMQAGARIRYGRMISALKTLGYDLVLQAVGDFDPVRADHDVYLFSKINDAQAMICARILRQQGKRVGIDLFDDYFSQLMDSRFTRLRLWLASILDVVDYALCSTEAMAAVARQYRSDVPLHIMNDPLEVRGGRDIAVQLKSKLEQAHEKREIRVVWFGIGDNPHFRVGLSDLATCAPTLARMRDSGWSTKLTILTNERALTAGGLSFLRHLPLPFELELWTEEKERELLDESLVCLLPVNAQNFSAAKSLNRAVTALSSGCQVISPGFPLYASLEPLIYENGVEFLDDLAEGELRFRADRQEIWTHLVQEFASPDTEAEKLMAFMTGLGTSEMKAPVSVRRDFAVIHGAATRGDIHKLTRRLGGVSVASPFCAAKLAFDIRFLFNGKGRALSCFVSEKMLERLDLKFRKNSARNVRIGEQIFWDIRDFEGDGEIIMSSDSISVPMQLNRYSDIMNEIRNSLRDIFGSIDVIISETSPLPYSDIVTHLQRPAVP